VEQVVKARRTLKSWSTKILLNERISLASLH